MAQLSLRKLSKSYGSAEILKDISLDISDGEFVVLVGPSGCGKSTLLRLIAGLDPLTSGEISIGGRIVNDLEPAQRKIAMVFQTYALYPHKNVRDNMTFGLKYSGLEPDEISRRVRGSTADQAFLREITVNACDYFTTVLAPGSDSYHANHLHLDLMRHDSSYQRRICQPKLNFARRIKANPTAGQIAGLNYKPTLADGAPLAVADNTTLIGSSSAVPMPLARPFDPKVAAALPPEPETDDDGDFKGVY